MGHSWMVHSMVHSSPFGVHWAPLLHHNERQQLRCDEASSVVFEYNNTEVRTDKQLSLLHVGWRIFRMRPEPEHPVHIHRISLPFSPHGSKPTESLLGSRIQHLVLNIPSNGLVKFCLVLLLGCLEQGSVLSAGGCPHIWSSTLKQTPNRTVTHAFCSWFLPESHLALFISMQMLHAREPQTRKNRCQHRLVIKCVSLCGHKPSWLNWWTENENNGKCKGRWWRAATHAC